MTNPAVPRLEDALDVTTLEILKNGSWGGGAPVTQETLDNLSDLLATIPVYRGLRPSYTGSVGVVYRTETRYMYVELVGSSASLSFSDGDVCISESNIPYTDMLEKACSLWL